MESNPKQIRNYQVIRKLGSGTSGTVYEVEQPQMEVRYAAKLIPLLGSNCEQAQKEANHYKQINHPHILKMKECFTDNQNKCFVIILQLCEGGDLRKKIQPNGDQLEIITIMQEIANGIQAIHLGNIIHRDIKPENIFFKNGHVKIGDLGVSKNVSNTQAKTLTGTLYYIAPQINKNIEYGAEVDIWALGIIFIELFLGKNIKVLTGNIPPCFNPSFPGKQITEAINNKTLLYLIERMLCEKPQERITIYRIVNILKTVKKQEIEEIQAKSQFSSDRLNSDFKRHQIELDTTYKIIFDQKGCFEREKLQYSDSPAAYQRNAKAFPYHFNIFGKCNTPWGYFDQIAVGKRSNMKVCYYFFDQKQCELKQNQMVKILLIIKKIRPSQTFYDRYRYQKIRNYLILEIEYRDDFDKLITAIQSLIKIKKDNLYTFHNAFRLTISDKWGIRSTENILKVNEFLQIQKLVIGDDELSFMLRNISNRFNCKSITDFEITKAALEKLLILLKELRQRKNKAILIY